MAISSINPTTGQTLEIFREDQEKELDAKLQGAQVAFPRYRLTSHAERSDWLRRAADILEDEASDWARIMTTEMGKTFASAVAEAKKCALACRFYADNASRLLADLPVETKASRSFVRFKPLGPVLAIMPWNFPFWQVFRFAAPALAAGNVGLLKHASNVPQCALAIEEIIRRAGFPPGCFTTLLAESGCVEQIIADRRVAAVTITGSEPAGRAVASQAGQHIKKVVLELGGSDPFIVMASVDLQATVQAAVNARIINNGQSCIAAKRFIVHDAIYPEFSRLFAEAMSKLRCGDPFDASTDVGPLATEKAREQLHAQVVSALDGGAQLLTGGLKINGPGFFYQPTVLANIQSDSPVYRDELFGPVALLFRVSSAAEAIAIANDSPFGLGASAWTTDEQEIRKFENEIEAGQIFINAPVASDPRLPFGGIKNSGHGRELSSFGLHEFTNIQTIWNG